MSAAQSLSIDDLERKIATRRQDRGAMIAEQPIDEDGVAGFGTMRAEIEAGTDHADPGGIDEELVASAAVDDLGIAGDDGHARRRRRLGHGAGDAAQERDLDTFLDDDAARKIERLGAADGEIIDGAADGKLANVAAGKFQRIDHEGIGGEGEPIAMQREIGQRKARLVFERYQRRILEGADEDIVDEIAHRLAAATMGKTHLGDMNTVAHFASWAQIRGHVVLCHAASAARLSRRPSQSPY